MGFLILLGIAFVIWLFFSKKKSQDLSNLGQGISKTISVLNEVAGAAEKASIKLHEESKKILVKTILDGMKSRSIPLSEKRILEAFKDRPDLIDLAMTEWANQTLAAQTKLVLESQALQASREKEKRSKQKLRDSGLNEFNEDQHVGQKNLQPVAEDVEWRDLKKDEKSVKEKSDLELVKIESIPDLVISSPDLPILLVDVNELEKSGEIFIIRKNRLDESLRNFILIRFFLTGKKDFPNLTCVKNKLLDTFSVQQIFGNTRPAPREYLPEMWNCYIDDLIFDQSKIKKIKGIYHFTHMNNLRAIFEHGLLTRDFLESSNIPYFFNDDNRWDGVKNSVSISISHPNHKMFIKYRKRTVEKDWVVLKISEELLCGVTSTKNLELHSYDYLNKAIFCKKNAASFSEKNTPIENRKKYSAFLEMFESPIGMTLPTYTVDNQAEILYQGSIPKAFIVSVLIQEADSRFDWIEKIGVPVLVEPELFKTR